MAILRSTDPKSALYCVQYNAMMLVLAQLTLEDTGTICMQQHASATLDSASCMMQHITHRPWAV